MRPLFRALLGCALLVLVAACEEASPSPTAITGASLSATASAPASTDGAEASAPATSSPGIAAEPPPLALEPVGTGFAQPIGIFGAPNGWLLINEQAGRVVALDPSDGTTVVALDISDHVRSGGEQGLLGLALHPDWPDVPRAFVHYSGAGDGRTVLSEFTASPDDSGAPILDRDSEHVLLEQAQPFANHNGGQLAFGPDGYLWMALGDGGSGGDPQGNGQNPATLLGKILRIDVDAGDTAPYAIPPDNPFADGADGAPEVYLYGLRNPWRFSFDAPTGQLWIGDVGQNAYEEVDRIEPGAAGANLGWNVLEASHCYASPDCSSDGTVLPVAEYGRDLGCAVVGGFVYRGEAIPQLRGWYLASDNCSGLLFGLPSDATGVNAPQTLLESGTSVSSFGQGSDGELYLAGRSSGEIYRIVAGG